MDAQKVDLSTDRKGRLPKVSGKLKHTLKSKEKRLNVDELRAWAKVGCTIKEMAGAMGVSEQYLYNEKVKNREVAEALSVGYSELSIGLRSTQVRLALTGHAGMLIWLGKQVLGQTDKQEVKSETTVNVTLQEAMKELRALDKDEVLAIRGIIEQNNATDAEFTDDDQASTEQE